MDAMQFAINMERDGEKYYQEQAEKNGDNGLGVIFRMLAKEEARHAGLLEDSRQNRPYALDMPNRQEINNVFAGMSDFKLDTKKNPDQLDAYRLALIKEKQSIDLYKKMMAESDAGTALFEFLIGQEETHYRIIEDIIQLVKRPKEWVESAEFGIRPEY